MPSPLDGASEMCACPSPHAGTHAVPIIRKAAVIVSLCRHNSSAGGCGSRRSRGRRYDMLGRRRDGVTQLALVLRVTHVMTMSNDDIITPGNARSRSTSGANFRGPQARGPIIDQEGREIPAESLGAQFNGLRFDFANSSANPFGNLTREQRLARLDAVAKLL